ncbi:MAG: 3',5'-cyclic-nucleotide phosphodiesterase [Burkholderiaceae bacterium]
MKVRVLGCSGGIGARARTTSFLVDTDVLLDAGTGVEDLSVEELAAIDHVFLTHSHLDHICALPLLVDSVGGLRSTPVTVHALPETIEALQKHIFNWVIWPDFTEIPHYDRPWMRFAPLRVGQTVQVGDRSVRALTASHTVPAVAYHVSGPDGSFVFSGDTGPSDEFWRQVNGVEDLRFLIIETAFANRDQDLATTARHLYPIQLGEELAKLRREPQVLITHLKPSDRATIEREIEAWAGRFSPRVLERGEVLEV